MHIKSYHFRTEGTAHSDSRRPQVSQHLCSRRDHKQSRWYLSPCVSGRDIPLPRTQDTGHRTRWKITSPLRKGCEGNCWSAALVWLTSLLNSRSPTYTFYSPWIPSPLPTLFPPYEKPALKGNVRWSDRVHNPPSSQIAGHVTEAPIKIPSLSLLIGSGSDRWQECQLFRFHNKKRAYLTMKSTRRKAEPGDGVGTTASSLNSETSHFWRRERWAWPFAPAALEIPLSLLN